MLKYQNAKKESLIAKKLRINDQIFASKIFLIDNEGHPKGVMEISAAKDLAKSKGLDLVEISPNSNPPVAKIMDVGKYTYEQEKALRKQKAKGKSGEIKEMRIGFRTGAHDREIKANKIREFLAKSHKVRISMRLMGREMKFINEARRSLEDFALEIGDSKIVEPIKKEANILSLTIAKN